MNTLTYTFYQDISYRTSDGSFITLDFCSSQCGISIHDLRGALEELKELGFAVENENGIQITEKGKIEARSRWVD